MNRRIEDYLTIVQSRTKQHQEIINKKKEEKEITQKYLFDNLISLMVNIIRLLRCE